MDENILDKILNNKHLQLIKIAKIDNIFFIIAQVFYIIMAAGYFFLLVVNIPLLISDSEQFFTQFFLPRVNTFMNLLLQGVVVLVVLKSIHLGLNMIVETDVNYRKKKFDIEVTNE
jgi:hypothetical protein